MPPKSINHLLSKIAALRFIIVLTAVLITAGLQFQARPLDSGWGDAWLRDQFTRLQAQDRAETRFVLVDIDESSIKAVGAWPWPRARIADLIEDLLGHYGARGIALDMVLPEAGDAAGDQRLAMLAQQGPLVLGQVLDYEKRIAPLRVGYLAGGVGAAAPISALMASGYIANHAGLGMVPWAGNIGYLPDQDGLLRHLPLLTQYEGLTYPSLSLALVNCCTQPPLSHRAIEGTLDRGLARVPFARQFSAYTVIPAQRILNLSLDPQMLEGQLVILGSSSLGITDRVPTPLDTSTAGMMVHAEQLSALLDQQAGLHSAHWPGALLAVAFTALVALAALYTLPRLTAWSNLIFLFASTMLWLMLAYFISLHDDRLAVSAPLIGIMFLVGTAIPFDWRVSQRRSRKLLNTLLQYVSEPVVNELLKNDFENPLVPKRQPITVLIADMEGYSRRIEFMPIDDAAHLTRVYLDCLTRPVLDHGGTLDRHTGDGLVAFWGAPLPTGNHADQALSAAKVILEEIQRISTELELSGQAPLRVRIGIESGLAITGDFGSSARSIYTAVGECVNIASRLEHLARELPFDVIIGNQTARFSKQHRLAFLGEFVLRGMEKPENVYTFDSSTAP